MKTFIYTLSVLLSVCTTLSAQITKAELQVAGLTCSMCSKATDKQLRSLDFIEDIDIDLSKASFVLHFKKDKQVDFDQIRRKVEDAGFSVASLKPVYLFAGLKINSGTSFVYAGSTFVFLSVKEQTLNGEYAFKIVEPGFISAKEAKKYEKEIVTDQAIQVKGKPGSPRIYHISL